MSHYKANFIKVAVIGGGSQTMPVVPEKRLPDSEIRIEPCNELDAETIAEGLYTIFPDEWWRRKEPPEIQPDQATRVQRLAKRILPSLTVSTIHWIKAVLVSSGEIVGIACWVAPGNPIHNHFLRSATEFYGWKEQMGWTDEEIEERWSNVSNEGWDLEMEKNDVIRKELMGDEPHWYLAPLMTWPGFQGRGVGKKLMNWAIEQADKSDPPTAMYLETRPTARPVYMHCGFVPQGPWNLVRRGPAVVRGLEAADGKENTEDPEAK